MPTIDPALSVHHRCALSVVNVIEALALDGLPAAQVYFQWRENLKVVTLPAVLVTVAGLKDEDDAFSTEQDGAVYPVRVKVVARVSGDDTAPVGRVLAWREQIRRALRRKPGLDGVPEVWKTHLVGDPVAEFDPQKYQEYEGGLTVLCYAVEGASN